MWVDKREKVLCIMDINLFIIGLLWWFYQLSELSFREAISEQVM